MGLMNHAPYHKCNDSIRKITQFINCTMFTNKYMS